jgi:hypothetical protein
MDEIGVGSRLTGRCGAEAWWLKLLAAELRPGVMTETEVARIERDEADGVADPGLRS